MQHLSACSEQKSSLQHGQQARLEESAYTVLDRLTGRRNCGSPRSSDTAKPFNLNLSVTLSERSA